MLGRYRHVIIVTTLLILTGAKVACVEAQEPSAGGPPAVGSQPGACRLTLQEAQQRALSNSRLRSLALMNIQAKQESLYVMEADYYPKIFANFIGMHFDQPLGKVLVPARFPSVGPIAVNLWNQDWGVTAVTAVQPITAFPNNSS